MSFTMGRLHIHLRQLILASAVAAAASCGSDEVLIPDDLRGEPTCMWIIGTWGHFSDGGMRLIFEEANAQTAAACVCMTDADFEFKSRADELNDMALGICEELTERYPFEWDECQQDHNEGEWLDMMFRSAGNWEHPSGTALGCIGE
jgi:hypothetical protein